MVKVLEEVEEVCDIVNIKGPSLVTVWFYLQFKEVFNEQANTFNALCK